MLALGRLLRLSLAPSAVADVAAGIVLAAGAWPAGGAPLRLMLASLCVYHGGMALNDWADRHADARDGRPRPIPSGAFAPRAALALAVTLLLAGPVLALSVAPRCALALGTVALLAAAYDLGVRGPWLGPLLLGGCRAGNLGAGQLLGLEGPTHAEELLWPLTILYGLYVLLVSRLARLEDAPEDAIRRGHPAATLACAALALAAIGLPRLLVLWRSGELVTAPASLRAGVLGAALLAPAGALGLVRRSLRGASWSAEPVGSAVGMALRRLLVATSAIAAQAGTTDGLLVAAAILLGYPLSFALRRLFPPT
jgi:4-hydroxybenzoate polyprenyltransferase